MSKRGFDLLMAALTLVSIGGCVWIVWAFVASGCLG